MSTHTTNAIVQTAKLVTLGDAIRAKAGLSDEMTIDEMATAVANIETGGTYQSKTVTPSTSSQTVTPDSGYDALSSVTVSAMPSGSASTPATTITATPTISVSSSGLITASVSKTQSVTPSVSAGYVASGTAGTITVSGSDTSQLTTQSAQTITPTTTDQTIASGTYLTGTQTIEGDANLIAANIAEGVSIFGITGTHSGGGGGSSTTTVSFSDESIFQVTGAGYIFYVDGDGNYQRTTSLASMSACSYEMLSKSLIILISNVNETVNGGIYGSYDGCTYITTGKITIASRATAYYYVYQVD